MARPTRTIWYSWCYDCVFVLNDKATLDAGWVTRLYIVIPSVTLLRDCSVSESNSDHATVTLEDIPSMYLFACLRAERACAFAWTRVLQVVSAFLQRIFGRETDGARMMFSWRRSLPGRFHAVADSDLTNARLATQRRPLDPPPATGRGT